MGRKLNPAEAQQLGLDDSPRSGGKRKLSAQEAEALGLGGEGAAAPPQKQEPETFELPYPDRPVPGLALDAKTRQPVGSLTGPANPVRAAGLALTRGFGMGFGAKAAAGIDSILPEALGGKSYDDSLKDYRNAEAVNSAAYPNFEKPYELYGAVKNPVLEGLGAIGQGAKGLSGVALRALAAIGGGGITGYLSTLGKSDKPIDDPQLQEEARHHAGTTALLSGGAQLALGEPLRAGAGYVAKKIAGNDATVSQKAEELIASAQGKAAKQKQEAVGAVENLDNARGIRDRMGAVGDAPRSMIKGLPPDPAIGDPLYHVQGMAPDDAERFLVEKMRMVPEEAADFVKNEAAPYLKQPAPGAATAVIRRQGPQRMNELLDARVGNADRAINELYNSPVQVPSRGEAVAQAEAGLNSAAAGQAKRGGVAIALGALGKATGNPLGIIGGAGAIAYGAREVARAAFSAPAVLNRLRSIPGAGRAIGNAAARGTTALEATLYTLAKGDPKVAQELENIRGEMAPKRIAPASEEE